MTLLAKRASTEMKHLMLSDYMGGLLTQMNPLPPEDDLIYSTLLKIVCTQGNRACQLRLYWCHKNCVTSSSCVGVLSLNSFTIMDNLDFSLIFNTKKNYCLAGTHIDRKSYRPCTRYHWLMSSLGC